MFVVFIKEWLNVLSTDRSNHSHLHMNLYKISIFPLCVTPSNDFAVSQSVTVAYFIFGNIGIRIIFCIRTAFAFICTSTATYIAAFYSIHCSGIKLILLKRVKSDFSHDCYRFCVINFFCLPVAIRNEFPYLFPCSILPVTYSDSGLMGHPVFLHSDDRAVPHVIQYTVVALPLVAEINV